MSSRSLVCSILLAALSAWFLVDVSPAAEKPADAKFLWEIGKRDGGNAEFALAPNAYAKYRDDPLFVVGTSDAKREWPYAHPGPDDPWAGSRPHAFTIAFQLKQKPQGECRLLVDFVDTQGHDAAATGRRRQRPRGFATENAAAAGAMPRSSAIRPRARGTP